MVLILIIMLAIFLSGIGLHGLIYSVSLSLKTGLIYSALAIAGFALALVLLFLH